MTHPHRLRTVLRYANRALAAAYLFGWVLVCTWSVGRTPASEPTTWASAWQAVATIALAVLIGWLAGLESKERPDDGDGASIFPFYGVAPQTHDTSAGWIGSTRLLPADQWPANFEPDPGCEGCGTYTHCLHCAGTPPAGA